jgi:hypothetical protein
MPLDFSLGMSLISTRRASGAAAFSPAVLFAGSVKGAWYDPSDLSSMFQDTAGTTPVAANNDPVGRINDKSGNGNHLLQATAGKRPLYQTASGLSWLLFDGVDDGLATATGKTWAATSDYCLAVRSAGDPSVLAFDGTNSGTEFLGVLQSASAAANNGGVGTPSNLINGSALSPDTRGGLFTALNGVDKVFECQGAALDFSQLSIGDYAAFITSGRVYGIIVSSTANSAQRAAVRTYLGAKAGLSI